MSNHVDLAAWGAKVLGAKTAPPPRTESPSATPSGGVADLRTFNKTIDDLEKSLAAEADRAKQVRIASQIQVAIGQLQGKLAAESNPKMQQVLSALIDKAEAAVAQAAGPSSAVPAVPSAASQLVSKEKGAEYTGEEREYGWRACGNEELARSKRQITIYDQDPASTKSTIEGGQLKDAKNVPMTGTFGYVINPKDAGLHTFELGKVWIVNITDPNDREEYTGAWPPPPSFWTSLPPDKQLRGNHHTTPLAGEAVAGAGEVTAVDGQITNVSNRSGHYKPNATLMIQTVEELLKQGAFVDEQYMMDNPDPSKKEGVPLFGKALELFTKTMIVQDGVQGQIAAVQPDLQSFRDKIANLKGQASRTVEEDASLEATERELMRIKAAIDHDLATVAAGKRLLAKMGAAPSKKVKGSVDFIEGAASKTGLGVAMATAESSAPIDFLATGAGATVVNAATGRTEKVADLKGAMLKELQAGQKTKREALDSKALGRLERILDDYKTQLAGLTGKESTPEYKALHRQIAALEASFSQAPPSQEEIDGAIAAIEALAARCGISTTPPAPTPASATPAPATSGPPGLADWVAGVNYSHANQQIADALGITLDVLRTIEAPTNGLTAPNVANQLGKTVDEVAAIFLRLESTPPASPPSTDTPPPAPPTDGWDTGTRECSPSSQIAAALGIPLTELQAMADDDNSITAPIVASRLGRPVAEVAKILRKFEV